MAFCYVLIPFRDGGDYLRDCLESLIPELEEGVDIVLIDDGSKLPAIADPSLQPFLRHSRVHLLRHEVNAGPAAARNTGLQWCREAGAENVILLDSDCLAKPGFISAHVQLQKENPNVACIGGAIQGVGPGPWARLDALMSWFMSMPGASAGFINDPYHLPTTNMSLKLKNLPQVDDVFDPSLRTGEDVVFVRELRNRGETVLFSPEPEIIHRDRATFFEFFCHQYRYGLHTYVARLGKESLTILRRTLFVCAFVPGFPLYVLLAVWLNAALLVKRSPWYLIWVPVLILSHAVRGVAVMDGAIRPKKALYPRTPILRVAPESNDHLQRLLLEDCPQTRALPYDSRLDDYRLIWHDKPVLRELYSGFYRRMAAACRPGMTLEIGGGSGDFKEFSPHVVSTDILFAPWLDSVCDAQALPFGDASFDNVIMMDVFHHLERPTVFLQEALRILKPGGRLVMLEPLITPVSHYCYHYFHPEPVVMNVDPFHEPAPDPKRDPYDSNQAIPTLMFFRHQKQFTKKFPGFSLKKIHRCGLIAVPLSGGFRRWSLIPAWAISVVTRLEKILIPVLGSLMGFRMLVILERRPD